MEGTFEFVLVPASAEEAVQCFRSSKAGGLSEDALRKRAELYFGSMAINASSQQSEVAKQLKISGMDDSAIKHAMSAFGDKMSGQVEIITLSLPSLENNFHSVSIYCDGNSRFRKDREAEVNTRATALARSCGHTDVNIMGWCFIGRAHDDERIEWERLDFTESDLDLDSPWVSQTRRLNAGKNTSSWSSTGLLSNMAQQQQKTQLHHAPKKEPVKSAPKSVEDPEEKLPSCGYWMNQDLEELEVRIPIQKGLQSKHLLCQIFPSRIILGNKLKSKTEGSPLEEVSENLTVADGIKLFGMVDVDASTWSIQQEVGGRILTISLSKAKKKHWKTLISP